MSHLTAQQVADLAGVDRKTVCRWAAKGLLPFTRDEKGWRQFRSEDVRALIEATEATHTPATQLDRLENRAGSVRRGFDLIDTEEI